MTGICDYAREISGEARKELAYYLSQLYVAELFNQGRYGEIIDFVRSAINKLLSMGLGLSDIPVLASLADAAVKASILRDLESDIQEIDQLIYELNQALDQLRPESVQPERLPSNVSNTVSKISQDIQDAINNGLLDESSAEKLREALKTISDIPVIKKILIVIKTDVPLIASYLEELEKKLRGLSEPKGEPYQAYASLASTMSQVASIARKVENLAKQALDNLPETAATEIARNLLDVVSNTLNTIEMEARYLRRFGETVAGAYSALADFFRFLETEYNPSQGVYPGLEPYHSRLVNDVYNAIENAYELLRIAGDIEQDLRVLRAVLGDKVPKQLSKVLRMIDDAATGIGEAVLKTIDTLYTGLGSRNNDFKDVIEEGAKKAGYVLPPIETSPVKDFERYLETWIQRFQASGAYWSKIAEKSSGLAKVLAEAASIDSYLASFLAQLVPSPETFRAGEEFLKSLAKALEERSIDELKKYVEPILANKEALAAFVLSLIIGSLALGGVRGALERLSPRAAEIFDTLTSLGFADPFGVALGIVRTITPEELGSASILVLGDEATNEIRERVMRELVERGASEKAAEEIANEIAEYVKQLARQAKRMDLGELSAKLAEVAKNLETVNIGETLRRLSENIEALERTRTQLEDLLESLTRKEYSIVGEELSKSFVIGRRSAEEILTSIAKEALSRAKQIESQALERLRETKQVLEAIKEGLRLNPVKEALKALKERLGGNPLDEAIKEVEELENNLEKLLASKKPSEVVKAAQEMGKALDLARKSFEKGKQALLEQLSELMRKATTHEELEALSRAYQLAKDAQDYVELAEAVREAFSALAQRIVTPEMLESATRVLETLDKVFKDKDLVRALYALANSLGELGIAMRADDIARALLNYDISTLEELSGKIIVGGSGLENRLVLVRASELSNYVKKFNELLDKHPELGRYVRSLEKYLERDLRAGDIDALLDTMKSVAQEITRSKDIPLAAKQEFLSLLADLGSQIAYLVGQRLEEAIKALDALSKLTGKTFEEKLVLEQAKNKLKELGVPEEEFKAIQTELHEELSLYNAVRNDVEQLATLLRSEGEEELAAELEQRLDALGRAARTGEDPGPYLSALLDAIKKAAKELRPGLGKNIESLLEKIKYMAKKFAKPKEYEEISKTVENFVARLKTAAEETEKRAALGKITLLKEKLGVVKAPREAVEKLASIIGRTERIRIGNAYVERTIRLRGSTAILDYKVVFDDGHWIEYVEEIRPVSKRPGLPPTKKVVTRIVSEKIIIDPELMNELRSRPEKAIAKLEVYAEKAEQLVKEDPLYSYMRDIVIMTNHGALSLADLLSRGVAVLAAEIATTRTYTEVASKVGVRTATIPGTIEAELRSLGLTPVATYRSKISGLDYIVEVPLDQYEEIREELSKINLEIETPTGKLKVPIPVITIGGSHIGIIPVIHVPSPPGIPKVTPPKITPPKAPQPTITKVKPPKVKPGQVTYNLTTPGVGETTVTETTVKPSVSEKQGSSQVPSYQVTGYLAQRVVETTEYPEAAGTGAGGAGVPPLPPVLFIPDIGAALPGMGKAKSMPEVLII